MRYDFAMRYWFLIFSFLLLSCDEAEKPAKDAALVLQPAMFSDLPGWDAENFAGLTDAFEKSCGRILKNPADKTFGPIPQAGTYGDWQVACKAFADVNKSDPAALRAYFEANFQPFAALAGDKPEGLFTGYYEASLRGSRTKTERYKYPLHTRPDDLIMVDLGEFRESLKGQRIAGRVKGGNLKPYEDRAKIVAGDWPHEDKVLVWVDDPVDAFFVQIQGSGVVELEEGGVMRIGYAAQNGHAYHAIGKELVKRGIPKEEVSMQRIRAFLAEHPEEADAIMNTNPSYVFFQEQSQGATGGEGVVLTAGRSLAIDRSKIPYGMPLWVDIEEPMAGVGKIQRMMMAQDTGGAIVGAVRGDVFWGYGAQAEAVAGEMKAKGRYWFLLPKASNQ